MNAAAVEGQARRQSDVPLRIGMIGAGDMSRYHLAAWRKVPGVDVVAIANRTRARAEERAASFAIPAIYDDPVEMLGREHLDAVDIVTTRETHVELALLAADHGVDVLCQKPLAPSLREAQELVVAVDGRIRLMVHENRRFAPHFRAIRKWLDARAVGAVRQAVMTTYRSSMLPGADGRRPAVERASYYATEPRLLIGEALIHQLDVLRYLLGPLRVVAARALRTEPDIPGETAATILLETVASRSPVVVAGSYVAPGFSGAGGGTSALGAQTSDRLEILGERSSVIMDETALELRGIERERLPVDYAAAYQACFDAAIRHFVACMRTGEPFETSADDNLETLRLVEDAYALADAASPWDRAPIGRSGR